MKEKLSNEGVFIRSLTTNMRNTTEVGEVTRTAQFENPNSVYSKLTKNIEALPVLSNVRSSKPLVIPYLQSNRKIHFREAMKIALKKIKQGEEPLVVMFDPREIQMNKIKECLINNNVPEETITLHPDKMYRQEGTEHLETFLKNPKGIYLVPQDCFTGCEAHHVLFILSERKDYGETTAIRCHISRAVSNLIVMHEIVINEHNETNYLLSSVDVEKQFLACCKEPKQDAFKCQNHSKESNSSRWQTFICKACVIYCHRNCEERTVEWVAGNGRICSCASMTNCLLKKK